MSHSRSKRNLVSGRVARDRRPSPFPTFRYSMEVAIWTLQNFVIYVYISKPRCRVKMFYVVLRILVSPVTVTVMLPKLQVLTGCLVGSICGVANP